MQHLRSSRLQSLCIVHESQHKKYMSIVRRWHKHSSFFKSITDLLCWDDHFRKLFSPVIQP